MTDDNYNFVTDFWFGIDKDTQGFSLTPILRKLKKKIKKQNATNKNK